MAATPHPWYILTVITVLVVQLCIAEKSCTIRSTAGPLVQRGSSFKVYCTFICKCKIPIFSMDGTPQHDVYNNSTTLLYNVVNITNGRTYSCQCNSCGYTLDPCGLDINTGYPPDTPENINCTQEVTNGELGVVMCTWNRGRDTYLKDTSNLWVRTTSGNHTDGPKFYAGSTKGNDRLSANFIVSSSVQEISVWVNTSNKLGSAESTTLNLTLSDIVMPSPPVLAQAECSSRACNIQVAQAQKTQHIDIQYKTEQQAWMTYRYSHSGWQAGPICVQSISSLEPYRLYYFRARTKFSTGLWSQWSANISNRTQEEAPAKELDVWYSGLNSRSEPITVHWKKLSDSDARGKIVEYRLKVRDIRTGKISTKNIAVADNHSSVHPCALCEVTVFALNSKGLSPPAIVPIPRTTAQPPQDVRVVLSNHSVSISWRDPETTLLHTGYLVEWYPVGRQVEELQWLRLGPNENHVIITENIEPFECYEGAVYVFYEKSLGRAGFESVSTWESAPKGSPSVHKPDHPILGDRVTVTWTEVPREQRFGCISSYRIYIRNIKNDKNFSVAYHDITATETMYIIKDLSPARYVLWMTAWTAKGEGPAGTTVQVFISPKQESPAVVWVTCILVFLIFLVVLCLCQISAIQRRFCMFFHFLMPDVVPDPANSKWARECAKEKGKISLQLHLSDSSLSEEDEDEPDTVEVEELHVESSSTSTPDASSHLLQPSSSPVITPVTCLYPQISYIKSFSHESDSSYHTHSSQDTNTTVDYISTHGPGNGIEEEDEFEEEFMGVLGFVPSHDVFMDPPVFSGKLTLDAVKIDCSDFLGNG